MALHPNEFPLVRNNVKYAGHWESGPGYIGIVFRCDEPFSGRVETGVYPRQTWSGPFSWQDTVKMFDRAEVPDPPTPAT